MSDIEPTRRPFQYSLWSLLVLMTVVSVLCSIGVCTNSAVPVVIIVGLAICVVGFGPLSLRKYPEAGIAFAVAGFVVRLVGLAIISFGLFLFAAQVAWRMRQRGIL
jgi:hypothetical protein